MNGNAKDITQVTLMGALTELFGEISNPTKQLSKALSPPFSGIIDIRSGFGVELTFDPENSKCEGQLESCCRHPDWVGEPIHTPPPKPKPKPYVSRCGRHNANGIGLRIQNNPLAATTQFGEWPHMCAVLEEKNDKNLYVCGASLIADDLVMTAAHCVE